MDSDVLRTASARTDMDFNLLLALALVPTASQQEAFCQWPCGRTRSADNIRNSYKRRPTFGS